jgi:hypothetical protein
MGGELIVTLQQLNFFLALVKYEKYTTAANELYISQSSLSKQILNLERELGVKLFNRNTRNIELTSIGDQLVGGAQKIVSEYEKMGLIINRYNDPMLHMVMLDNHPTRTLSLLTRKNDLPGFCDLFVKYLANYQNSIKK